MRTKNADGKGVKKSQILENEINAQRDKLKKMEEEYKEYKRLELEKNQKMIAQLIRLEKLDWVSIDIWQQAMPKIRIALTGKQADFPDSVNSGERSN